MSKELEVSVVMACLNEAETIGICCQKAWDALNKLGIKGEVVVSDNGSTDGSIEIAQAHHARVVHAPKRGYGNAVAYGVSQAEGEYVLMLDSDNTYDPGDLERFITPLREGYDLVMGDRFAKILPGAMPWHHQYIGNPVLSGLVQLFFHANVKDVHTGMKAFKKTAYERLHLQTGGMEYSSELVIHAAKAGLKITEIPITYYPRAGESKLSSFRDGWRHLRLILLYSPTHLYLWPGGTMMAIGLVMLASLVFGPLNIGRFTFGLHWMFVGAALVLAGFQLINLGFFARFYSLSSRFDDARDKALSWFTHRFRMEQGIGLGSAIFGLGLLLDLVVVLMFLRNMLDGYDGVRVGIVALTFSVIGLQIVFSSFFLSMMAIHRRGWDD